MSQSTSYATNGSGEVERRFRGLILDASLADDGGLNPLRETLREHFGIDPMRLAQSTQDIWETDYAPMQTGIDQYVSAPGRRHEVIGFDSPTGDARLRLSLPKMLSPASLTWPGVTLGQATWQRIEVGYKRTLRALVQGLVVIHDEAEGPAAIWVTTWNGGSLRSYTIMSATPGQTLAIAEEIRRAGIEHSPFIGEMFTMGFGARTYLPRPTGMNREDLIFAPGLLERIDQHAVGIAQGAERLRGAGQHLKRGLLLYGPPGTGKTHTLRYLISQLPPTTTIVVASPSTSAYGFERLANQLGDAPLMVLIDDVDATAGDRGLGGDRTALFTLLEAMDGLQGKGDILFVLTTNRLDVLEPAIAARPGRIDEVLEVPRPDADCRRRLFARYRQGMDLDISEEETERMVERTEGVTASFTKELLRRATVVAVERGAGPGPSRLVQVTGADVHSALDEMLDPSNPATRLLLGADPEHALRTVAVTTGAPQ